jgi:hypothetical protein
MNFLRTRLFDRFARGLPGWNSERRGASRRYASTHPRASAVQLTGKLCSDNARAAR